MKVIVFLLLSIIAYSQTFTKSEVNEFVKVSYKMMRTEGILEYDTVTHQYKKNHLKPEQWDGFIQKVTEQYNYERSYNSSDIFTGIAYSISSGISLGIYEANAFGYEYSGLPDSKVKDYLKWNPKTDAVFNKMLTPQKMFREIYFQTTRSALNSYLKYYNGNWVYAYLTWFTVHNLTATLYRDYAKYGTPFRSFNVDYIFVIPEIQF
jgi:hypothetical protein